MNSKLHRKFRRLGRSTKDGQSISSSVSMETIGRAIEASMNVSDQFWIDLPYFAMSSSRNAAIHKHLSVMPSIGRNLYS